MPGKATVGETGGEHNVFISWSGLRSQHVAQALREWLPVVLQTAKPWMSASDIEKGSRGLDEVSSRLQGMKVGIVCLTPENVDAPWILYEAGALSKTIDDKMRLCTYLLGGLQFQDVKAPLGMFQATNPDKQDTQKLMHTINRAVNDKPVPETNLDRLFERMWPELEDKLKKLPVSEAVAAPKRSVDDMVTEILEIVRGEINYREAVQTQISKLDRLYGLGAGSPEVPLWASKSFGGDFWSSPNRLVTLKDMLGGPDEPTSANQPKTRKK